MANIIDFERARMNKILAEMKLQKAKRPTKAKRQAQTAYLVRVKAGAAL